MTIKVFGCLIVRPLFYFCFDWEDLSNIVSDHNTSKFVKNTPRRIFNSLLGVWKCGQKRSFEFDTLHELIIIPKFFLPLIVSSPVDELRLQNSLL